MKRRWNIALAPLSIASLVLAALITPGEALRADDALLPADRSIPEVIDHYINAKLERLNVQPASPASDANLQRRTMLDLVGRIPAAVEARQYTESNEPAKREQLVDRLLESPAFVRHQANEFDTLLMYGTKMSLNDYLQEAFAENRPWDQMFREMIVGQEDDQEQKGAIQFVKGRIDDLDKLVNDTSVVFFGVNVSCAQCHDHPLVLEWTQNHFYGMKSFFNRSFDNGGFLGEHEYGDVSYQTPSGEKRDARLMFLTGTVLEEPEMEPPSEEEKKAQKKLLEELKKQKKAPQPAEYSRRERLVEIALEVSQREFFAKAIVNHLFYRFYGNGLVMPIDQMHPENPPSHPELMDWLARDLIAHNYDLKRLIRGLVLSDAYARSSRWLGEGRPLNSTFAVMTVRPLSPNQYATTLKMGSMSPDHFEAGMTSDDIDNRAGGVAKNASSIARLFDQPREDFQVSVTEALLLSNSERIADDLLRDANDSLVGKLKTIEDDRQLAETAVLNVFARPADDEEVKQLTAYLAERKDQREAAIRQVVWALLAASENRFNY
ncbi:MAG: DUF1549 domain-containing protein [Pirellulaceae bacterium]